MPLSKLSSPGGSRDIVVDLTKTLESGESLSSAVLQNTVTGVSVTPPVVLAASTVVDGTTVAAGKGFGCTITTTTSQTTRDELIFLCTGDSNTIERVSIPIQISTKV